jgi:cell wall assembly regulator SMI1
MEEDWNQIIEWMRRHVPHILDQLAPPATAAEIRATERALKVRFPPELKWLYRRHNACVEWWRGLPLDGAYWLPLDEVQKQWATYNQVREDGLKCGMWTDIPGEYAHGTWIPQWIPITDSHGGGWGHWVDLAPGPRGMKGQVLRVFSDSTSVADLSIGDWLMSYAYDLQRGEWLPSKSGGGLRRRGYPD